MRQRGEKNHKPKTPGLLISPFEVNVTGVHSNTTETSVKFSMYEGTDGCLMANGTHGVFTPYTDANANISTEWELHHHRCFTSIKECYQTQNSSVLMICLVYNDPRPPNCFIKHGRFWADKE